jgi:hypothetical protein
VALATGLICTILDHLDHDMKAALLAARLLLGHDRHFLWHTRARRGGLLDGLGAKASRK